MINERLKRIVLKNKMIPGNKTGFMEKKSTVDNLERLHSEIFATRVGKKSITIVFLDLKKAYDTVDRRKMIEILQRNHFGGRFMNFMRFFLGDNMGEVRIGNDKSDLIEFRRGLSPKDHR